MKRLSTADSSLELHPLAWQVFRDSAIATVSFLVIVGVLFL